MKPSSTPAATRHRSSAAAPRARNCAQPGDGGGAAEIPTIAEPNPEHPDGRIVAPSRNAPPPRVADHRPPEGWLTTSATAGPSSSTTHIEVANHGTPREQF